MVKILPDHCEYLLLPSFAVVCNFFSFVVSYLPLFLFIFLLTSKHVPLLVYFVAFLLFGVYSFICLQNIFLMFLCYVIPLLCSISK